MLENFTGLIACCNRARYFNTAAGLLLLVFMLLAQVASAQTLYGPNTFTTAAQASQVTAQNQTQSGASIVISSGATGAIRATGNNGDASKKGYNGYVVINSTTFNFDPGYTYSISFKAQVNANSPAEIEVWRGVSSAVAGSKDGLLLTPNKTTINTTSLTNFTINFTVSTPVTGQYLALRIASNVNNATLLLDDLEVSRSCTNLNQPTVTNTAVARCGAGTVNLTSTVAAGNVPAEGATNRWYDAPIGGLLLQEGLSYSPTLSEGTARTVYVGSYNSTTGCESTSRVAVTARAMQTPTASINPVSPAAVCQGGQVALTAVANPTNPTPASGNYTYQWFNGSTAIPSATGVTYAATASGDYSVVITTSTGGCSSTASSPVTVTVNPLPGLPTNTSVTPNSICAGESATFQATLGDNSTAVRWYSTPTGSTSFLGEGVLSGQASTLTRSNLTITTTLYAAGYNSATQCETSSRVAVTVTVKSLPTAVIVQGATASYCAGSSVTLSAQTASGNSYIWFKDGEQVGTGVSFAANEIGSYTVQVTNNGCSKMSAATTVTEKPLPIASINPPANNGEICAGESLTLNAQTGTDYTYVWTLNGSIITGQSNSSLAVSQAGDYRVIVTANGCSNTSAPITVTVNPTPVASITAEGPVDFCVGGSVRLRAPNAPSGQVYTYEWFLDGNPLTSDSSIPFYDATLSGSYTVKITTGKGCTNTSEERVVTVGTETEAAISYDGVFTNGPEFCQGGFVDLRANQAPAGETYTYQWYNEAGVLQGQTNRIYRATTTGTYYVVVKNTSCEKASIEVQVTVYPQPTASIDGSNQTQCIGTDNTNSFSISGSYVGSSAIWASNNPDFVIQNPVYNNGVATATVVSTGSGNAIISLTATRAAETCTDAVSTVGLAVNPQPQTTITPSGPTTFCQGDAIFLNAPQVDGYTYRWFQEGNTNPIGFDFNLRVSASGTYTVEVTSAGCIAVSAPVAVTVNPLPTAVVTPTGPVAVCEGGSVTLNASSDTGTSFIWFKDGVQVGVGASFVASEGGSYTLQATNDNNCSKLSAPTTVTINQAPTADIVVIGNQNLCEGNTVTLQGPSAPVGRTYNYQWLNNGLLIAGETRINFVTAEEGSYTVRVTDVSTTLNCNTTTADPISVTVSPKPGIPGVTSNERCGPGALTLTSTLGTNGTVNRWYASNVSTDILNEGLSYEIANVETNQTFWVSTVNAASGCESERVPVDAIINELPTLAISSPAASSYCISDPSQALTGNPAGGTFRILQGTTVRESNATVFNPSTLGAGDYIIEYSYTGSNGCANTLTKNVTIAPRSIPTGEIYANGTEITSQTSLEAGKEATFSVEESNVRNNNDAERYQWFLTTTSGGKMPVGDNSPIVRFTMPTDYTELSLTITFKKNACYTATFQQLAAGPVSVFPVEIIYLNANRQGNQVVLEWATAMELDNTGFEVQVSSDGFNYRKLTFIPTKNGNSSTKQLYAFTDMENGKYGTRYYRLKQIDVNGTFEMFGPKAVTFGNLANKVIVFPNPFQSEVTLDIAADTDGEAQIVVTDAVGKQLLKRTMQVQKGFTTEKLMLDSNLPKGLYIIRAQVGGETHYIKLLKE
ncbi:T9SS type A sorting domain-containing protein [Pontibacter sp. E15-1]|uniref:Ig-like domain-containing protein n=1 Tax=Pontibacter sp. E15-1 TaxID=2919918 RepID=UPI001F50254D|nr:T9SS type A sorting domain-containing protein [Pontibacter sp. E15-1]MCJ8165303.1 T9SS type A sorting domain-containing protein [Pontibacter sp. E15-1]